MKNDVYNDKCVCVDIDIDISDESDHEKWSLRVVPPTTQLWSNPLGRRVRLLSLFKLRHTEPRKTAIIPYCICWVRPIEYNGLLQNLGWA